MFRFNVDIVEPRGRIDFLTDFLNNTLAPFHIEPIGEHPFRNEVAMQVVGTLPLANIYGAGYRGRRGRSEIARSSDHFYVAAIHMGGATRLSIRGEEMDLDPGDVFILDTMHDVSFGLEQPYQHLLVKLPKDLVEARVRQPEKLHGSILSRSDPLASLCADYLAAGFRVGSALPPAAAAMYARHLLELFVESFGRNQIIESGPSVARRAARLMAVKTHLAAEPSLSVVQVAAMLGITPRYVQMLFEAEGTTFTAFALNMRLERARTMLIDRRYDTWTVSAIAYEAGFGDVSHFHRKFKRRYGASPSDLREEAMRSD